MLATCRPADADWCRRAGAADALDYADPTLGERVRELASEGVDLYVDTSGRIDPELACDLLAFRGRIVLLAGASARPMLPLWKLYTRDGRIHGFVISRATIDELADAAAALNRCLAIGRLLTRIAEVLPLERASPVRATADPFSPMRGAEPSELRVSTPARSRVRASGMHCAGARCARASPRRRWAAPDLSGAWMTWPAGPA